MTSERLPADASVDRIGLRVAHPERLAQFYQDVVGLAHLGEDDRRIDLGAGKQPLVTLHGDPGASPRPRAAAGLFHTAIRVPSRKALGEALHRIRLVNALQGASDHGFSEALYLADPEDNGLEVYCDRPRSDWPRRDDDSLEVLTAPLDLSDLPSGGDSSEVPRGTDLGHVHLEVTDIERSLGFYRDVLGFSLHMRAGQDAAFLANGEYHHHVGLNTWNARSEPVSGRGIAWLELAVPSKADLDALAERVDAADESRTDIPGGFAIDDPDDITLRCVHRR